MCLVDVYLFQIPGYQISKLRVSKILFRCHRNEAKMPLALAYNKDFKDRFWPTGDGLPPLNAHPNPDAQGATAKVSFEVLYSPVARPAFGQKQSLELFPSATASG